MRPPTNQAQFSHNTLRKDDEEQGVPKVGRRLVEEVLTPRNIEKEAMPSRKDWRTFKEGSVGDSVRRAP